MSLVNDLEQERDRYKQMLKDCLYAFNEIPNSYFYDSKRRSTYDLAAQITAAITSNTPTNTEA